MTGGRGRFAAWPAIWAARDQDVLIEFLAASLAGVTDRGLVPGIACLLNHVERQRQRIQPRVLKAIDRFEAEAR